MTEVISGFEKILASLKRKDCRDEGVIFLLDRMLKHDPSKLGKVIDFFHETPEDDIKGILAALIVERNDDSKYRQYLIDFHGWQEGDFDIRCLDGRVHQPKNHS